VQALPTGDLTAANIHMHVSVLGDLADAATAVVSSSSQNSDGFLAPLTNALETVLKVGYEALTKYPWGLLRDEPDSSCQSKSNK
jgi:hypothetical protein